MTLIKLKDLEGHLWHAAHIITGPIDASDYKTYIFPILFFKRICDVYNEEFEEAMDKVGDEELAKTLTDPNASKTAKKLAGSALSQKGTSKQTGADMEDFASKVLQSDKYSKNTKELAGSVLSQSNKKR